MRQRLTLFDALMVNLGSTQALAIFVVPGVVLAQVGTPALAAVVWLVAGGISWMGAATLAELAEMHPRAGGQYVYLERTYSRFLGFLYGWTLFWVIQTASIAAATSAFQDHLGVFLTLSEPALQMGGVALVLLLTIWNCVGSLPGTVLQNVATALKLLLIAAIIVACFVRGGDGADAFQRLVPGDVSRRSVVAFGTALVAALWAYDGWSSVTLVGGEVAAGRRTLARTLRASPLLVMALYTLLATALAYALPPTVMATADRVAIVAGEHVLGAVGVRLVAAAILVAAVAAVNGLLLTGGRLYYAMAIDGAFFPPAGRLTGAGVPAVAIVLQGAWAAVMVAWVDSFDRLLTYVVMGTWLFYCFSAGAVLVLRHVDPTRERPSTAPGYPWVTVLFGLFAWALVLETIIANPRDAANGLGIMLLGVPAYLLWTRRRSAATD